MKALARVKRMEERVSPLTPKRAERLWKRPAV